MKSDKPLNKFKVKFDDDVLIMIFTGIIIYTPLAAVYWDYHIYSASCC